jgi:hypothetical protein
MFKQMEQNTGTIDFNQIAKATLERKTIIFTGPELTVNYGNPNSMMSEFVSIANNAPPELILNYHPNDTFMIFGDKRSKIYGQERIRNFFDANLVNSALKKLVEIPFHLLVSCTPDFTIHKAFGQKNFVYKDNFYHYKNLRKIDEHSSCEIPLIYSIFGRIDDIESSIFSYSDLFSYIKSLNAYEFFPNILREELKKNAEHIVFLGMDFDKWYYQILLHILNLDVDPCFQYAVTSCNPSESFKNTVRKAFSDNLCKK